MALLGYRKIMQLRVFIIDPNDSMRESLAMHVESLGHEVVAASSADLCPHYHQDFQNCSQENSCGDAIILGQKLPILKGIDFIERRLHGGCKGSAANNAIVCMPWSHSEHKRADDLGCRYFETPIQLSDITAWLKEVKRNSPANR